MKLVGTTKPADYCVWCTLGDVYSGKEIWCISKSNWIAKSPCKGWNLGPPWRHPCRVLGCLESTQYVICIRQCRQSAIWRWSETPYVLSPAAYNMFRKTTCAEPLLLTVERRMQNAWQNMYLSRDADLKRHISAFISHGLYSYRWCNTTHWKFNFEELRWRKQRSCGNSCSSSRNLNTWGQLYKSLVNFNYS